MGRSHAGMIHVGEVANWNVFSFHLTGQSHHTYPVQRKLIQNLPTSLSPSFLTHTVSNQLSDGDTIFSFQDNSCHSFPSWRTVLHWLTFDTVQHNPSEVLGFSWHTEDDKQAQTILSYQVAELVHKYHIYFSSWKTPPPGILDGRGHKA